MSCSDFQDKGTIKNELKSRIGKKLILPLISDNIDTCKFKIVSYINGECASCIENIDLWENFFRKMNHKDSVLIIVYLYSSNYNYLKRNYSYFTDPFVTVVEDKEKLFPKKNNLSENKVFHTFITDQNNKVLLVGNPILNKNLEALYLKLLNNEISEYKQEIK